MEQEPTQSYTTADHVLKKLEAEKVTPIGRWHFILRNNSFWALWGLSVLIGACAIAASIFVFSHAPWQYEHVTHDSFIQFFFDVMPLFWFVSFALMVFFGYYNVRHTTRGYRFSFYLVVIASVVASFLGGAVLSVLGVGKTIDDFRRPLPFSTPLVMKEEGRWNNIEKGLLGGDVLPFTQGDTVVIVRLFSGAAQSVSLKELDEMSRSVIQPGARVRIIGKRQGPATTDLFIACVVLPWGLPGTPGVLPNTMSERKEFVSRSSVCKDVRPYQRYQEIVITN
jgi:uncharacterized membrane protein